MGKHIKTLSGAVLSAFGGGCGCGECGVSCQSACKTSCTVGNQACVSEDRRAGTEKNTRSASAPEKCIS